MNLLKRLFFFCYFQHQRTQLKYNYSTATNFTVLERNKISSHLAADMKAFLNIFFVIFFVSSFYEIFGAKQWNTQKDEVVKT